MANKTNEERDLLDLKRLVEIIKREIDKDVVAERKNGEIRIDFRSRGRYIVVIE